MKTTYSTTPSYSSTTFDSSEYYYDDDDDDGDDDDDDNDDNIDFVPTTYAPVTKPTAKTTKSPKGYESFIKSIPRSPVVTSKLQPTIIITKNQTENLNKDIDNDDDDEYYYDDEDDDDYDYVYEPPPNKPNRFMPHSETAAPKPIHTTTVRNLSNQPPIAVEYTTPAKDWSKSQPLDTMIPSIINFPKDIFHDIKPMNNFPRNINNITVRPYTVRTKLIKSNYSPPETATIRTRLTTARPLTTTENIRSTTDSTTTTRKIYTIRPNRGQSKWKLTKGSKTSVETNKQKDRHEQQRRLPTDIDDKQTNR